MLDFGLDEEQDRPSKLNFGITEEDKPKGVLTKVKEKADKFILSHLDELAQKKSGILNPNPEENPLIAKSILPEAGQKTNAILDKANVAPSYVNRAATGLYNSLIRPLASPVGALGTFLGEVNPVKEPIGLPKVEPPPAPKPVLGLPPSPVRGYLGTGGPQTRFIAGEAGVAENRLYPIDMGPVTPSPGLTGEGTVLPREYGSVNQVPPDLAARRGIQIGQPGTYPPSDVVPPPPPVEPPLPRTVKPGGKGELPRKYPAKKSALHEQILDEYANRPKPVPQEPVPDVQSPFQRMMSGSDTGAVGKDVSAIANRHAKRSQVSGRFINKTPDVAADMFDSGELQPKEDFTHSSFLQSMKDTLSARTKKLVNEEKGAVGPFGSNKPTPVEEAVREWGHGKNVNSILPPGQHTANIAQRDSKLVADLKSLGVTVGKRRLSNPSVWADIAKVDAKAGDMIANNFSRSPEWLKKAAGIFGVTRNLSLAQGVPTRSGTASAHGFNLFGSDIMARGFKDGIKDFISTTYNPKLDVQYIQNNRGILKEAIEGGLNWQGDQYSIGKIDAILRKIPGVGKARDLQAKLLEDPLFKVKAPAMQLKQYQARLDQIGNKLPRKEAVKEAASFANDFSGHVDKTFKDKSKWDAAQVAFLAPSWLRTRLNIAGKGLSGKSGYVAPLARGAAIGAGIAGADIASTGAVKYLAGKPSEVTGIPAGQAEYQDEKNRTSFKQRNIEPLGTSVEPARTAMQVGTQLGQGNLQYPFKYLRNKTSQPFQMIDNLMNNQDPFGNPLAGKDRFGKAIGMKDAALNIAEELGRPLTPGMIISLMDYYRGKAPLEETASRAMGLPITYTSVPKGKPSGRGLPRIRR